jgi:CRP-like cAMP-binding protein
MNLLLQDIASNNIILSTEEKEQLASIFETKKYKAKTMLLKEGDICDTFYFVTNGIIRNYFIDKNENEITLRFTTSGYWISELDSCHFQRPSHNFIQVLEDSETLAISNSNLEQLFHDIPKLERDFRLIAYEYVIDFYNQVRDNLTLSAEENYDNFTEKFPNLANQIAQKHIASYIGVTPAFFSRMKAKLLKK